MTRVYVALDLEMTGLKPERDAILEVGAVKFRDQEVIATWSSLVNPNRPLTHKIERLTGITQTEVDRAPAFRSVLPVLTRFIGEHPIVGHSIWSDLGFLQRAGYALPNPALDTFELACILMPYASRFSLARLANELGIEFATHHRALDDARLAHRLFYALLERAKRLDQKIVQEIARLGEKSDWPLNFAFQDVMQNRARTAFAPGTIGAQLAAKGAVGDETLGLLFSRDRAERPLKPKIAQQPLDADALAHLLMPEGPFATEFNGYEYRPQQVEVLKAVADAINNGATLLVEAGTGTGKSLAYLIPAIHWAVQNGQRVVISTNTINLQDQLYTKDIPDLRKVLNLDFKAVLLKGRTNYLCRRRLDSMRRSRPRGAEIPVLAKVLAWLPSTTTGDSSELNLGKDEKAIWAQLSSDPEHCSPESCQLKQENKCFFYHAREKAESAHVIIVNHALLLSDVAAENRVLPEYKYLVVDEAHHLEAQATDAFSFTVSHASLDLMLHGLANDRGGLIGSLAGSLRHSDVSQSLQRERQNVFSDVSQDIDRALHGVSDFFGALDRFLGQQEQMPGESETVYNRQVRLTAARRAQPEWSAIEIAWDPLGACLTKVREGIDKIYRSWMELDSYQVPNRADLEAELAFAVRRVGETRQQMEALVTKPQASGIYWATINKNTGDISLNSAPLHVGERLQNQLFAGREASILTSATLCVDKSFAHIKSRLGIGDWADELAVDSPFDFDKSVLLCVPSDIPEPGQPEYQRKVESGLEDLFRATQGRALVLFTSKSQLEATYRNVARELEQDDIIVIAQNLDGSGRQVLETFKTQERTVLFGVKSLWEGVDVVGEALSCLVITRLPFSVPSDPIFAARSETFDDAFGQYAVPEAVLRFRQGFGRLIRSKSDRGVVVLMDKRVLTKSYGRLFLNSLPPVRIIRDKDLKAVPQVAAAWIAQREQDTLDRSAL